MSGSALSLAGYMIVIPAMYILLAKTGRNKASGYGWFILSLLLVGVEMMLFSFDMGVG